MSTDHFPGATKMVEPPRDSAEMPKSIGRYMELPEPGEAIVVKTCYCTKDGAQHETLADARQAAAWLEFLDSRISSGNASAYNIGVEWDRWKNERDTLMNKQNS